MSWLFDRLCELAVADEIEVVLAVAIDAPRDRSDWADVLARVSTVPQLVATAMPPGAAPMHVLGPPTCRVDLDERPVSAASSVLARLALQAGAQGQALQVRGECVTLRPVAPGVRSDLGHQGVPTVVAADTPGHGLVFERVGPRGLSISVGGVDPLAQMNMASVAGVISVVDALVTLRSFAFGGSSAGCGERDVIIA